MIDLRHWMTLCEGDLLTEVRVTVWSGSTINVAHNPSRPAFEKFCAQRGGNLRGLLTFDGKNLYLWDAGSAVHPNIMQELGLDRVECIAFRSGRWWGPNLYDEETGMYKPAIQRVTPRKIDKFSQADFELLKQLGLDESVSQRQRQSDRT